MYTVDSGIPIPKLSERVRKSKYPFKIMNVGDSFAVDVDAITFRTLYSSVYAASKRLGMKFKVRTIGTDYRVWRVA